MGLCIGRGTIISIILVLLVLPSMLVLGDSIINRTKFRLPIKGPQQANAQGTIRVNGYLRGNVSGNLEGNFQGVIRGSLDAMIAPETEVLEEGGVENA